jgi:hypothetical protein
MNLPTNVPQLDSTQFGFDTKKKNSMFDITQKNRFLKDLKYSLTFSITILISMHQTNKLI